MTLDSSQVNRTVHDKKEEGFEPYLLSHSYTNLHVGARHIDVGLLLRKRLDEHREIRYNLGCSSPPNSSCWVDESWDRRRQGEEQDLQYDVLEESQ